MAQALLCPLKLDHAGLTYGLLSNLSVSVLGSVLVLTSVIKAISSCHRGTWNDSAWYCYVFPSSLSSQKVEGHCYIRFHFCWMRDYLKYWCLCNIGYIYTQSTVEPNTPSESSKSERATCSAPPKAAAPASPNSSKKL